jgi:hypothetical protein
MTRYFFRAQFKDHSITENVGEEFSSLEEAEAHAAVVASELGRNSRPVTVTVIPDE